MIRLRVASQSRANEEGLVKYGQGCPGPLLADGLGNPPARIEHALP
jgi:hypothetical protein